MPYAASGLSSRNGLPGVEQPVDPVAHQQLAAVGVLAPGRLAAALPGDGQPLAQLVHQLLHVAHPARLAIINLWVHRSTAVIPQRPRNTPQASAVGTDHGHR